MMNMDGSVFVQLVPLEHQPRLAALTTEEALVFDEVTKGGTNGATLKQLKRVGLRPNALNTIIGDLCRSRCVQVCFRATTQRLAISVLTCWH